MREVDPFDYWQGHSSAIEGLGGAERSPDPRYLFHTGYHEVRAGRARYVVRLNEVRASFGELAIRVHAWKPEGDSNISLVSGARIRLDGGPITDISFPVNFAAQKGVHYALYGYLSEDSDVAAQSLQVAIEEPEDSDDRLPEPPRSVLALNPKPGETRPPNALLHYGPVETEYPVSQSCTFEQVAALGLVSTGLFGRERQENNDAVLNKWSEILCLKALATYGAPEIGLEGLIIGPAANDLIQQLARSGTLICLPSGPPPLHASGNFFDFLLMPAGTEDELEAQSDATERWERIDSWLAQLKIGGLAALGLRYRAGSDLVSSSVAADSRSLSRNEIAQWCLRLIGSGYAVAPLAFAPTAELIVDERGLAGFILIIQRSRS